MPMLTPQAQFCPRTAIPTITNANAQTVSITNSVRIVKRGSNIERRQRFRLTKKRKVTIDELALHSSQWLTRLSHSATVAKSHWLALAGCQRPRQRINIRRVSARGPGFL